MFKTFTRITSLLLVASFFFIVPAVHAQAPTQLPASDTAKINTLLDTIQKGVRTSGIDGSDMVKSTIAPDARDGLWNDVFSGLPFGNVISFSVDKLTQVATSDSNTNHAKFTADVSIQTENPNYQGTSTAYFLFSKENDEWYLFDTDFYKYLGSPFFNSDASGNDAFATSSLGTQTGANLAVGATAISLVFIGVFFIVGLLFFIFWLWMLISVIRRPSFPDKIVWVLVVLLLQILGAIIYYFAEHRAYKKSLKQVVAPSYSVSTPPPATQTPPNVPPTPSI